MRLYGTDIVNAIENDKTINDQHPIVYAIENGIKIEGKEAIVYAIENGIKIEGKEAIVYAIEEGVAIYKKKDEFYVPIEYAIEKNIKIKGKNPIEYAIKNNIAIGIQESVTYTEEDLGMIIEQYDKIQDKHKEISFKDESTDKKTNKFDEGSDKFVGITKEDDSPDIKSRLTELYKNMALAIQKRQGFTESKLQNNSSELGKMLQGDPKDIAKALKEQAKEEKDAIATQINPLDLMLNYDLKTIHKVYKVGEELSKVGEELSKGVPTKVWEAIKNFCTAIVNLFSKKEIEGQSQDQSQKENKSLNFTGVIQELNGLPKLPQTESKDVEHKSKKNLGKFTKQLLNNKDHTSEIQR